MITFPFVLVQETDVEVRLGLLRLGKVRFVYSFK